MKKRISVLFLLVGMLLVQSKAYSQQSYLGDIKLTAINFLQEDWMDCDGQLLAINDYPALYALLGTNYGGNGTTNFALPDLRGRVPVHIGHGTGLSNYTQGAKGGAESTILSESQLPAHTHGVSVSTEAGTSSASDTTYLAHSGNLDKEYATTTDASNTTMVQTTGSGSAIDNRQPYLVVRYVICVEGLFPSRY